MTVMKVKSAQETLSDVQRIRKRNRSYEEIDLLKSSSAKSHIRPRVRSYYPPVKGKVSVKACQWSSFVPTVLASYSCSKPIFHFN